VILLATVVVMAVGFGPAHATAAALDTGDVRVSFEVESDAGSEVVAHLLEPGGDERIVSMIEESPGSFRGLVDIRPVDLIVVFEQLDTGLQSNPERLSAMGVDPALLGAPSVTSSLPGDDGSAMGWLGLGLGLAALSLLAFWVVMRPESDPPAA
jgi:hypothetical protein